MILCNELLRDREDAYVCSLVRVFLRVLYVFIAADPLPRWLRLSAFQAGMRMLQRNHAWWSAREGEAALELLLREMIIDIMAHQAELVRDLQPMVSGRLGEELTAVLLSEEDSAETDDPGPNRIDRMVKIIAKIVSPIAYAYDYETALLSGG